MRKTLIKTLFSSVSIQEGEKTYLAYTVLFEDI